MPKVKDPEWDEAVSKASEENQYYYECYENGRRFVKMYNPSLAELVAKRTGWEMRKLG